MIVIERLDKALQYMRQVGITGGRNTALVVAAALDRDIDVTADQRGRARLRHGRRRYYFQRGNTNFNERLARRCAKHKAVTSQLLGARSIPVPENAVFTEGDADRAWAWAKPLRPVVVKPANAYQGKGVHVDLDSRRDFTAAFNAVTGEYGHVLVEEYVSGIEHRALVIDGRFAAAARRLPANVIGDGVATIIELVDQKNIERDTPRGRIHERLQLGPHEVSQLRRQRLHPNSVPAEGQRVYLRATSNIHSGGDAHDATDDLTASETALVEATVAAIPGLRLAGVDIMLPRDGVGTSPVVLEVNPSPGVSLHHFPWEGQPRDMAGRLVDAMFSDVRNTADPLVHDDSRDRANVPVNTHR